MIGIGKNEGRYLPWAQSLMIIGSIVARLKGMKELPKGKGQKDPKKA